MIFRFDACRHCGHGPYTSTACNKYYCSKACSRSAQQRRQRLRLDLQLPDGPARLDLVATLGEAKMPSTWRAIFTDRPTAIDLEMSSRLASHVDREFLRLIAPIRLRPPTARQCKCCGIAFKRTPRDTGYRYCSPRCAVRMDRRMHGGSNLRRAKRAGVARERFDELSILERDGWACRICGIATPRDLRGTCAPNAPEIDHIVALSRGGAHAPWNCQCACRRCNGAKGAGEMRSNGENSTLQRM